jgi:hypothetical protein
MHKHIGSSNILVADDGAPGAPDAQKEPGGVYIIDLNVAMPCGSCDPEQESPN